jgi:hypothetical protein
MATGPVMPFEKDDPLVKLHLHIFCDKPDVEDLTSEQKFALHEFFHVVLAAGYRLYQVVPPQKAAPIIKKKFGLVLDDPPDDD